MKISLSWLKDYVDIKLPPEEMAGKLTASGVHMESFERSGQDSVIDFEITSNRNDCLSFIGIAREAAAITGAKLKLPAELTLVRQDKKHAKKSTRPSARIFIKDKNLCPRYTGTVIRNVTVKDSPAWLKEKLSSIGMRPVNNIVDITNYLLMETGQPMHAFDLDKISGSVVVRRAVKGEKIRTIDGSTRDLDEGMLVIADDKTPVAVAGVMGGLDTEVSARTKNILLESAYFDPVSVRHTARKLGFQTESSYRFERKVAASMIEPSARRAAILIAELAVGAAEDMVDINFIKKSENRIKLDPKKTNSLLGLDIPEGKQKKILESLGFMVKRAGRIFDVKAPDTRKDISQPVDLVEEIARINGYDKILMTVPRVIGNTKVMSEDSLKLREIRGMMYRMGLNEIISYNLIPEKAADILGVGREDAAILINPLSSQDNMLAPSLVYSMAKAIGWNTNRKNNDLALFEIAKVYRKSKNGKYSEKEHLCVGMTGSAYINWKIGGRPAEIFDVKGVIDGLLSKLGLKDIVYRPDNSMPYLADAASIEYRNKKIGVIARLGKGLMDAFDIRKNVFTAEIYLNEVLNDAAIDKVFKALPKFPSIVRDISIAIDKELRAEKVRTLIAETGGALVKNVALSGIYKGDQVAKDKTALLFSIEYRDDNRTLTENDVEPVHQRIKDALASKLGVLFR